MFRHLVHHGQKVAAVTQAIVRIGVGKALAVPVSKGRDSRNLGDKPVDLFVSYGHVAYLLGFRIEGGQRGNRTDQDPHGMGVVPESVHEFLDVLMDNRVMGDVVRPFFEFGPGRQQAVNDQEGDFEKGTFYGQVLDGIAPVAQYALFPIDVGYAAPAGGGVGERRIVPQQTEVVLGHLDLSKVRGGDRRAVPGICPVHDGNFVFLAGPVIYNGQRVGHAVQPPETGLGRERHGDWRAVKPTS